MVEWFPNWTSRGGMGHGERAIEVNRPTCFHAPCCFPIRTAGLPILFRRARLGVGFDFVPLFVHYASQFALHRFESIVNDLE